jgi:hypothetical protein
MLVVAPLLGYKKDVCSVKKKSDRVAIYRMKGAFIHCIRFRLLFMLNPFIHVS